MISHLLLLLLASPLLLSIGGCSDEPFERATSSKSASETPGQQEIRSVGNITWLEIGDQTKPEAWLAALDAGNHPHGDKLEARFRVLIALASQAYLESPRMVANRTAQLAKMLKEESQSEGHMDLLEGFLSIPKKTRTSGERIYSDMASHYVNLRRSGLNRKQTLEQLRGEVAAIDVEQLVQRFESASLNDESSTLDSTSRFRAKQPSVPTSPEKRARVDLDGVTSTMERNEVKEYVRIAASLSAYELPDHLPNIARVTSKEIERVICQGQRCGAVAFFDDRTQTVYVDERLDLSKNLSARSFVVHEVVHYFHLLNGKLSSSIPCDARLALEKEAYDVQNAFLAQNGSYQRIGTRLLQSLCRRGVR